MLTDSKTIDMKLEKLKKIIKIIKNDNIDQQEFDALMSRHYSSGMWLSSLMLAILNFPSLIGLGSIGACIKTIWQGEGLKWKTMLYTSSTTTLNLMMMMTKSPGLSGELD